MAKGNSSTNQQINVSMKSLFDLCLNLSPDQSICIRGRHAVGKSESVEQIAGLLRSDVYKNPEVCKQVTERLKAEKHMHDVLKAKGATVWHYDFGVPVIMRRLSQLTEGDVTGLPELTRYGTTFKPCDWLLNGCDFPVILFLDERNRALEGVKQAVFQLTDSKAFYGNRLHDETRVYIAENVGDHYMVQSCDPAEISRSAIVELDPDHKEWLDYSRSKGIHEYVLDYIAQNPKSLEHLGEFQPNMKYPDRRSWFKLAKELARTGLMETPENPAFYVMSCAMLGVTEGISFYNYVKNLDRNVTPEEILASWSKAKKRLGGRPTQEKLIPLQTKLSEYISKNGMDSLSDAQKQELKNFFCDIPSELKMTFFTSCMAVNGQTDLQNLHKLHALLQDELLATLAGSAAMATTQTPVEAPKVKSKK